MTHAIASPGGKSNVHFTAGIDSLLLKIPSEPSLGYFGVCTEESWVAEVESSLVEDLPISSLTRG